MFYRNWNLMIRLDLQWHLAKIALKDYVMQRPPQKRLT